MRVETRKTLVLTKAEQKVIQDVYNILNNDIDIDIGWAWEILDDISKGNVDMNGGYSIKIVD